MPAPTDGRADAETGPRAAGGRAGARRLPGQGPGEGTIPTFLTVTFILLPLWAIWYFLTHLAPFLAIQPPAFQRAAPAAVRTYRAAEAAPAGAEAAALAEGTALYLERCSMCHGVDGQGQTAGPYTPARALAGDPLVRALTLAELEHLVAAGFPGDMPAWGQELDNQQIAAVALFVKDVLGPLPPPAAPAPGRAATAGGAP